MIINEISQLEHHSNHNANTYELTLAFYVISEYESASRVISTNPVPKLVMLT